MSEKQGQRSGRVVRTGVRESAAGAENAVDSGL